jgi:aryl-alcohol dehydrogenase (NADP+)
MNPLCRAEGVALIPWSPLARGFLAGNRSADKGGDTERAKTDNFAHQMYYQPSDFAVAERCAELAKKRGVSSAQLALAWILHQPSVTAPIIGASKMYQLEEAVTGISIKLDAEQLKYLEELYQPHSVLGHS